MSPPRMLGEIKLTVPWGHIAAKTWGTKNGNKVLVVHGTLDNAGSFDRIIPLLPNNFYYVAIDLPGHGLSSPMPPGIQLDYFNYIFAIRLVLDALDWDNCIYIGHSFGAQLGVFTCILYPDRISKIACLDGFFPKPLTTEEMLQKVTSHQDVAVQAMKNSAPILYTKDEVLYSLKNKRSFSLNSQAAEALFVRGTTKVGNLYKYNRDFRLKVFLNPLYSMSQYIELVKRIRCPVFITLAEWSWLDNSFKKNILQILKDTKCTNYTIVRVMGNHDVHNNNPENVAPHVRHFLNGTIESKL